MTDSATVAQQESWAGAPKDTRADAITPGLLANTLRAHTRLTPVGARNDLGPKAQSSQSGSDLMDRIERLDNGHVLVSVSPAMREVRRQAEQVAGTDAAVLLVGESGTGKEVIARLIHKLSNRSARKFLRVNCAALPLDLLESELFGHEAGAFSGARQTRAGKFEICHKGTILLDEIVGMPVGPQAKLLHVLQDGEFARLGSASTIHSDVRVLASTNANVREAVRTGALRVDLYYRLNVFTIQLPPLRERREDLPHLLHHFAANWAACYGRPRLPITRRMLEACADYSWPGNVRELENFVKRYLVLGDEKLAVKQLENPAAQAGGPVERLERSPDDPAQPGGYDLKSLVHGLKREAERDAIARALDQSGGNRQNAAALLHISLRALHYKIRAYGIESASSRARDAVRETGPAGSHSAAAPRPPALARAGICPLPPQTGSGRLIPMDRVPLSRIR